MSDTRSSEIKLNNRDAILLFIADEKNVTILKDIFFLKQISDQIVIIVNPFLIFLKQRLFKSFK